MGGKMTSDERMEVAEQFDKALSLDPVTSATYITEEAMRVIKRGRGRPSKINEVTLRKLRFAFLIGCTDVEACLIADIGESTLYDYQSANPDFSEEKEALKAFKKAQARITILKHLHHPEIAKWYLELKANDEFSRRTISSGEMLHGIMTPDRAKRAEEILGQFDPNPSIRLNNEQAVVTVSGDDSA